MIRITLWGGGQTTAFENGEQVPVAQKSWLMLYAEYLASQDIDPTEVDILMPDGSIARIFSFTDEDGNIKYNWTVS